MKKKLVLIMILVLIIAMPSGCFLKKKLVDSTTKEVPTTVAPTTTTAAPTKPTTTRPTTVKATTTAEPTTVAPTTVAPTTAAPTTKQTTAAPTTTVAPTTAAPTTKQTTATPTTTVPPTTAAPTTVAPTTAAPTAWIEVHGTSVNYENAMKYRAEKGYESIPRDATLDALAQARAEELAMLGELNHTNMPNLGGEAGWEGLSTTITAGYVLYGHCGDDFAATSIGIGAATYHRADGTTYSVCCMLLKK